MKEENNQNIEIIKKKQKIRADFICEVCDHVL
jgi:competence CoiA-like predicted nuclease